MRDDKKIECKAFLDSGNLLIDPLTKQPVCLINYKLFSQLFTDINLEELLRKGDKVEGVKLAHYINLSTLNNTDKILVFQVYKIKLNNHVFENQIFGLSLKNFNQTFGTDMILHNNFALQS